MTMVFNLRGFTVVQHDTNYTAYYGNRIVGRYLTYRDLEDGLSILNGGKLNEKQFN